MNDETKEEKIRNQLTVIFLGVDSILDMLAKEKFSRVELTENCIAVKQASLKILELIKEGK